jgi:hypothetical protein
MDWSSKLTLVGMSVALLPLFVIAVVLLYAVWCHKHGVSDPEKRVAIILRALLPGGLRASASEPVRTLTAEEPARQLPPAA